MRKALLMTMPIVLLAAITTGYAYQPGLQVYGYSSDDFYGGGSYLGVDTRDVTSDRLGALKLKEERGVEVTMVDQDAPAGKAGIKEHDVILSINSNSVESVEELRRMIREIPPGRVINIGISRDGQPLTLKAQLADRKKSFAYAGPQAKEFHFEMPAMPNLPDMDLPVSIVVVHSSMRSGLMVENLTPQLGDFFGAPNGQGVLVRSVEKGSNAERAGFHAGDVITKVNSEPVSDSSDFTRSMREQKSGGTVSIGIIRDKKEQTITLTLPERRQSGGVFQESLDDDSDMDADSRIDLRAAESEIAQAKPQLAIAVREAQRAAEEARKEFCERQKELKEQQEELQQQLKQQQEELREQQHEQQEQVREQREELRNQLQEQQEQMREEMLEQRDRGDEPREVRGGLADI